MHWRCGVTFRPWARNAAVSSAGVFTAGTLPADLQRLSSSQRGRRRDELPGAPVHCDPMSGAFDRATALRRLAETHFDVLVIGGGVVGTGTAVDAASRGLRTALVERDDFASGTSSKSSKLVHGGLR